MLSSKEMLFSKDVTAAMASVTQVEQTDPKTARDNAAIGNGRLSSKVFWKFNKMARARMRLTLVSFVCGQRREIERKAIR